MALGARDQAWKESVPRAMLWNCPQNDYWAVRPLGGKAAG